MGYRDENVALRHKVQDLEDRVAVLSKERAPKVSSHARAGRQRRAVSF